MLSNKNWSRLLVSSGLALAAGFVGVPVTSVTSGCDSCNECTLRCVDGDVRLDCGESGGSTTILESNAIGQPTKWRVIEGPHTALATASFDEHGIVSVTGQGEGGISCLHECSCTAEHSGGSTTWTCTPAAPDTPDDDEGSSGTSSMGGRVAQSGDTGGTVGISGAGGAMVPDASMQAGGASGGGKGEASCLDVTPCGGYIVGTWTATSSCLRVTGEMDLSSLGLGCTSAPVTGLLQVTGGLIVHTDWTYLDNTTTSGDETIMLPASCLELAGGTATCEQMPAVLLGLGYDSVSCASDASGGCTCPATVHQIGGMGLLSASASTSGTFKPSGTVATTGAGSQYSYCVVGLEMTWTPESTSPTTTGTILLKKQ